MSGSSSKGGSGSGGVEVDDGAYAGADDDAATGGATVGRRGFRRRMRINTTPTAAMTARITMRPPTANGPSPIPPGTFTAVTWRTAVAELPASSYATTVSV